MKITMDMDGSTVKIETNTFYIKDLKETRSVWHDCKFIESSSWWKLEFDRSNTGVRVLTSEYCSCKDDKYDSLSKLEYFFRFSFLSLAKFSQSACSFSYLI